MGFYLKLARNCGKRLTCRNFNRIVPAYFVWRKLHDGVWQIGTGSSINYRRRRKLWLPYLIGKTS
jgi:hypothetical protein